MNLLIDYLPSSVVIGGADFKIRSDFRTSILFEQLMFDSTIEDKEKIALALELYYPDELEHINNANVDEAVEKMLWFFAGGKEKEGSTKKTSSNIKRVYDYEYDDDYIFAAFMSQYNIDLNRIKYLHWWKFKALFNCLKEDNEIVKIMQYRGVNLSKIKDKEERKRYAKLKEIYKLPVQVNKDEKERLEAIKEALANNGDISKLI